MKQDWPTGDQTNTDKHKRSTLTECLFTFKIARKILSACARKDLENLGVCRGLTALRHEKKGKLKARRIGRLARYCGAGIIQWLAVAGSGWKDVNADDQERFDLVFPAKRRANSPGGRPILLRNAVLNALAD